MDKYVYTVNFTTKVAEEDGIERKYPIFETIPIFRFGFFTNKKEIEKFTENLNKHTKQNDFYSFDKIEKHKGE